MKLKQNYSRLEQGVNNVQLQKNGWQRGEYTSNIPIHKTLYEYSFMQYVQLSCSSALKNANKSTKYADPKRLLLQVQQYIQFILM